MTTRLLGRLWIAGVAFTASSCADRSTDSPNPATAIDKAVGQFDRGRHQLQKRGSLADSLTNIRRGVQLVKIAHLLAGRVPEARLKLLCETLKLVAGELIELRKHYDRIERETASLARQLAEIRSELRELTAEVDAALREANAIHAAYVKLGKAQQKLWTITADTDKSLNSLWGFTAIFLVACISFAVVACRT